MIAHTRAVRNGASETLVIGDMPFGSYECSDSQAVETAVKFLSMGGADAVKLEGGNQRMISRVRAIIESGIPVMGHIGLLPQSIRLTGGYRVIHSDRRESLFSEALALQDAGVFAMVLECVEEELARELTSELEVPTIGIGAGRYTDGQILVLNDILGLSGDFKPRFVKRYAELGSAVAIAIGDYLTEVREGRFPQKIHVYGSREEK
jgi:3-methyl-2-oxobutanoate hydroxymethyltransferase